MDALLLAVSTAINRSFTVHLDWLPLLISTNHLYATRYPTRSATVSNQLIPALCIHHIQDWSRAVCAEQKGHELLLLLSKLARCTLLLALGCM